MPTGTLHEEVGRLPERYRTPVILCYLEGLTYEETARRIGCPVGTVRVRLSRRRRLRARLTRRGLGPERVAAVGILAGEPALAPLAATGLGAGWVDSTVKSALAYVAGRAAAAGVVPALAVALGDEMVRSLAMNTWKLVMLALLALGTTSTIAVGLAGGGGEGGGGQQSQAAGREGTAAEAPPAIKDLPRPVEDRTPAQASASWPRPAARRRPTCLLRRGPDHDRPLHRGGCNC